MPRTMYETTDHYHRSPKLDLPPLLTEGIPEFPFLIPPNPEHEHIPTEQFPVDEEHKRLIIFAHKGEQYENGHNIPWDGYYTLINRELHPVVHAYHQWFQYTVTWDQNQQIFIDGRTIHYVAVNLLTQPKKDMPSASPKP